MSPPRPTEAGRGRETCPVCLEVSRPRLRYRKWGFDVVEYPACGTARTVAEGLDLDSLYDEGYFQGERTDGYGDYRASEPVLRREFRSALSALRRHGVEGGRLLELGCAYGFFLEEAARYFDVVGNDVSAAAVGACKARGLEAIAGDLGRDRMIELGPFDAVVMLDVIEHLERPIDKLRAVADALRPGGALMLTTGDWGSALARATGRRWRLATPPQHLFFFTRDSLRLALERSGFEVRNVSRPWKRVPAALGLYQVTRRLRLPIRPPRALHRLGVPVNLFDTVRVVATRAVFQDG